MLRLLALVSFTGAHSAQVNFTYGSSTARHFLPSQALRIVRRILEKRVCQDYWNQRESGRDTARNRYAMKHRVSNHLRNIYGFVPTGFRYAA